MWCNNYVYFITFILLQVTPTSEIPIKILNIFSLSQEKYK